MDLNYARPWSTSFYLVISDEQVNIMCEIIQWKVKKCFKCIFAVWEVYRTCETQFWVPSLCQDFLFKKCKCGTQLWVFAHFFLAFSDVPGCSSLQGVDGWWGLKWLVLLAASKNWTQNLGSSLPFPSTEPNTENCKAFMVHGVFTCMLFSTQILGPHYHILLQLSPL